MNSSDLLSLLLSVVAIMLSVTSIIFAQLARQAASRSEWSKEKQRAMLSAQSALLSLERPRGEIAYMEKRYRGTGLGRLFGEMVKYLDGRCTSAARLSAQASGWSQFKDVEGLREVAGEAEQAAEAAKSISKDFSGAYDELRLNLEDLESAPIALRTELIAQLEVSVATWATALQDAGGRRR